MLVVDDAKNIADQFKDLLNVDIKVKEFTDSSPLLKTLGSTSQMTEKGLGSIQILRNHILAPPDPPLPPVSIRMLIKYYVIIL